MTTTTTPTMHVFEVINPSDKMTLLAPSLKVAGLAALYVSTAYGVEGVVDGELQQAGPFLFGGVDSWCLSQQLDPNVGLVEGYPDLAYDVAAALQSWALGDANDRRDFDAACAAIDDPAKREQFIKERNDRRRSSISDGESYAHGRAKKLRGQLVPVFTAQLNQAQLDFEAAAKKHFDAANEGSHGEADAMLERKKTASARLAVLRERLREMRRLGLPDGVA